MFKKIEMIYLYMDEQANNEQPDNNNMTMKNATAVAPTPLEKCEECGKTEQDCLDQGLDFATGNLSEYYGKIMCPDCVYDAENDDYSDDESVCPDCDLPDEECECLRCCGCGMNRDDDDLNQPCEGCKETKTYTLKGSN